LFRDRNFDVGCVAIFTFGVVLFATLALLPPLLQQLLGYPVVTTGWSPHRAVSALSSPP